ncbi:MAG TPA: peptide deformylase [Candidatus Paceibacterota bacterium]|nr:peptide deformylase [Candidatus Paceibacterota bacterium]
MEIVNQKLADLNRGSNNILEQIPELTYIGDPVLRLKTSDVSVQEGVSLGKKLIETLIKYQKLTGLGVGLAAPQIGSSGKVFVTHKDDISKIFINPKIINLSEDENLYKENCLSSSHVWCDVKRPKSITISYANEDGESVTEEYEGFWARLIQHEYDHLQGVVNVDKAVVGTIEYRLGNPKEEKIRE